MQKQRNALFIVILCLMLLFEDRSYATNSSERFSSLHPKIIALAREALGSPYEYGAIWNGPGSSTDCSGLVHGLLLRFGISCPRTARAIFEKASMLNSSSLSIADLEALDVLIFASPHSSSSLHVGLHLGSGQVLHVRKTGTFVEMFDLFDEGDHKSQYWRSHLVAIFRPRNHTNQQALQNNTRVSHQTDDQANHHAHHQAKNGGIL